MVLMNTQKNIKFLLTIITTMEMAVVFRIRINIQKITVSREWQTFLNNH